MYMGCKYVLSETEGQAEDRVPAYHTSYTTILGDIKKHLKGWVTLRRPIGKGRRPLWHITLLPCNHDKYLLS